ncbi:hypothetical protein Bca4012_063416 [Brassica carinata]
MGSLMLKREDKGIRNTQTFITFQNLQEESDPMYTKSQDKQVLSNSYSKLLMDLKKEFCCNGTLVQDSELGQVIYDKTTA